MRSLEVCLSVLRYPPRNLDELCGKLRPAQRASKLCDFHFEWGQAGDTKEPAPEKIDPLDDAAEDKVAGQEILGASGVQRVRVFGWSEFRTTGGTGPCCAPFVLTVDLP